MNLREEARGRECQVRLEGCSGGGEDASLAHYSLAGISGKGLKSPDVLGAWCCDRCHSLADSRVRIANLTKDEVRLALAEGVFRTIYALMKEGYKFAK